jgi:hypothetical protein
LKKTIFKQKFEDFLRRHGFFSQNKIKYEFNYSDDDNYDYIWTESELGNFTKEDNISFQIKTIGN